MNLTLNEGSGLAVALTVFTTILSLVTTIFWMVVGWRAMRAHERIADRFEDRVRAPGS